MASVNNTTYRMYMKTTSNTIMPIVMMRIDKTNPATEMPSLLVLFSSYVPSVPCKAHTL